MKNILKTRDRADIPNQAGFPLTIFFNDGNQLKTIVIKKEDGTHTLAGLKPGLHFAQVVTWEPRKL